MAIVPMLVAPSCLRNIKDHRKFVDGSLKQSRMKEFPLEQGALDMDTSKQNTQDNSEA